MMETNKSYYMEQLKREYASEQKRHNKMKGNNIISRFLKNISARKILKLENNIHEMKLKFNRADIRKNKKPTRH